MREQIREKILSIYNKCSKAEVYLKQYLVQEGLNYPIEDLVSHNTRLLTEIDPIFGLELVKLHHLSLDGTDKIVNRILEVLQFKDFYLQKFLNARRFFPKQKKILITDFDSSKFEKLLLYLRQDTKVNASMSSRGNATIYLTHEQFQAIHGIDHWVNTKTMIILNYIKSTPLEEFKKLVTPSVATEGVLKVMSIVKEEIGVKCDERELNTRLIIKTLQKKWFV